MLHKSLHFVYVKHIQKEWRGISIVTSPRFQFCFRFPLWAKNNKGYEFMEIFNSLFIVYQIIYTVRRREKMNITFCFLNEKKKIYVFRSYGVSFIFKFYFYEHGVIYF